MKIKPPEEIFQVQDLYHNKGKTFLTKIENDLNQIDLLYTMFIDVKSQ